MYPPTCAPLKDAPRTVVKGDPPSRQNSEHLSVYFAWKEIWLEVWIPVRSWPWLKIWSGTWKEHSGNWMMRRFEEEESG